MIDERELRIGNWVQNDAGIAWQFENFGQLADQFAKFHNTESRVEPFPIPLTTEILKKCGYIPDKGKHRQYDEIGDCLYWSKEYDLTLYINTERKDEGFDILITNYEGEFESIGMNIYHLHQLQNLIYALTGKELEIKL